MLKAARVTWQTAGDNFLVFSAWIMAQNVYPIGKLKTIKNSYTVPSLDNDGVLLFD